MSNTKAIIDDLIKAYKSNEFGKEDKKEIMSEINSLGCYPIFINGLTFYRTSRKGECGANRVLSTTHLYCPLFLMGTCGDDAGVIPWNGTRELIKAPKKMNYEWFKLVADRLKEHPCFDWDWASFRNNILYPNREHIKNELGISEVKLKRFLEDGMVFINNFNKDWADEGEGCGDFDTSKLGLYPNFKNFLECNDLNELEY
jgi:hypothetical protein